jgi:hypothetical protein
LQRTGHVSARVAVTRRLIAGLLIFASASLWAAESVRVLETRSVAREQLSASAGASHELRLTVYSFRGTRWQSADIVAAVNAALPMLAQCGVAVAGVELKILETPPRFHFYSTPVARELAREMTIARPAVFFVDDTHSEPAYDAEAIGLGNAKTRPELANTIWFAYGARDLPLALAHELVHVLSDSGEHSDEPDNLMWPETSPANTRLTTAQCNRLRIVAEANGLLARRAAAATPGR